MTKSDQAIAMGFRTSFLEHLCQRELYKRDPNTKMFRDQYITQLIRNYRSHPAILKIPNEQFYESTLLAKASGGKELVMVEHPYLIENYL